MSSDFTKKIKSEVSIESYISRFLKLNKKGRNFLGLCPFHNEKSPSFNVSPEKQIYHCFGCGASGDIFNFVKEYNRVDFVRSMEILSEFSGIPIERNPNQNILDKEKEEMYSLNQKFLEFFRSNLKSQYGKLAKEYLDSRKISESRIEIFKLGYSFPDYNNWQSLNLSEKEVLLAIKLGLLKKSENNHLYDFFRDRVMFPIFDINQKVVGFGGRILSKTSEEAKYINSPASPIYDKGKMFFNLNLASKSIRTSREAILVEGYLDVIGLHSKEIENVVAPLGTSVTDKQVQKLKSYADKVILLFDGDKAGRKAAYKATEICIKENLNSEIVLLKDSKDPFDLSIEHTKLELFELLQNRISASSFIINETVGNINPASKPEDKKNAVGKLFDFIKSLKTETEIESYLLEGSKKIGLSFDSLKNDFKSGGLKLAFVESDNKKELKKKSTSLPILERSIIVLFLIYPNLQSKINDLLDLDFEDQTAFITLEWIKNKLSNEEEYSHQSFIESGFGDRINSELNEIIIELNTDLSIEELEINLKSLILQKKIKTFELVQRNYSFNTPEDFLKYKELVSEKEKVELEFKQLN